MTRSAQRSQPLDDLPLSRSSGAPAIVAWMALAYFALIVGGFVVFRLPGAMIRGNEISDPRKALFTVINAATLTGFQQSVPLDEFGPTGRPCIIFLTVAGTLFTLIVGGLALTRIIRLPYDDRRVIRATIVVYAFCILVGGGFLLDPDRPALAAMFDAASAFGNSGLYLARLPGVLDWRTHAVLLPLALLGGLSIPVLMEIYDVILRRRAFSAHARVVFAMTALFYLAGVFIFAEWGARTPEKSLDWPIILGSGSTLAMNSRTAGFALLPVAAIGRAFQWIFILMMLIGASPAGSAGGWKTTTIFELCRGVRAILRGNVPGRIFGIAAVWTAIYFLAGFATLLGLLWSEPEMPADRLVFLSASAISTTGLSHDPVTITGSSFLILSATMLFGRIAPLLILWWTAPTITNADLAIA